MEGCMSEKLAMPLSEAAVAVGLSHWTLRKAINTGKLKAMRVGRKILVSPKELERFLHGGTRKKHRH
jgi:excisionase family DNA binding protein